MHSGGLEFTKQIYTRLEDNLIRHRGDRLLLSLPNKLLPTSSPDPAAIPYTARHDPASSTAFVTFFLDTFLGDSSESFRDAAERQFSLRGFFVRKKKATAKDKHGRERDKGEGEGGKEGGRVRVRVRARVSHTLCWVRQIVKIVLENRRMPYTKVQSTHENKKKWFGKRNTSWCIGKPIFYQFLR